MIFFIERLWLGSIQKSCSSPIIYCEVGGHFRKEGERENVFSLGRYKCASANRSF